MASIKKVKRHSILGLLPLFKVLEDAGGDPEKLVQKFGLDLNQLNGAALIDQEMEFDLITDVIDLLKDPILGVKVGSQVSFTSYGTFAMLLMSANTLGDAVRAGEEFQSLSLLFSSMKVIYEEDWVELRYTLPAVAESIKDFVADRDLMGTYLFIREFLSEAGQNALKAGVARKQPDYQYLATYRSFLNISLAFDQPYNWIRLPANYLRVEQKHRNSWAHKLYRMQAYELLKIFEQDDLDIAERVREILKGYDSVMPDVYTVSKTLGVSERTLRRRLDASGYSFRDLVDEIRQERALDMLANRNLSVREVSEALGYTEPSSFVRAFKRWTGVTPKSAYRKSDD